MRSLGTRRAALGLGVAAVAAMALTGCSAGQFSQTANIVPAIDGVNASNSDSSVSIRNLQVPYPGVKGYPAGASAPLEVTFFNETSQPVIVTVASRPVAGGGEDVVSAQSVNLVGGTPSAQTSGIPAEVEPSGTRPPAVPQPATSNEGGQPTTSASVPAEPSAAGTPEPSAGAPSAPTGQPAKITIAALGSASFRADDAQSLQLAGLSGPLLPGTSVNLVFTFDNGAAPLTVAAPVAMPLSPAPRGSAEIEPISEGEGHGGGH
jgi:hypothetical protein